MDLVTGIKHMFCTKADVDDSFEDCYHLHDVQTKRDLVGFITTKDLIPSTLVRPGTGGKTLVLPAPGWDNHDRGWIGHLPARFI